MSGGGGLAAGRKILHPLPCPDWGTGKACPLLPGLSAQEARGPVMSPPQEFKRALKLLQPGLNLGEKRPLSGKGLPCFSVSSREEGTPW